MKSIVGNNGIVKGVHVQKGTLGAIRERVMESTTGDYILKADADDVYLPDRVRTQMAYLKKYPDIVGVSPSVLRVVGKNARIAHYGKFLNDPVLNVISLLFSAQRSPNTHHDLPWSVSNMLIRKKVLDKVKYDEEYTRRGDRLYVYKMFLQFPFQLLSTHECLCVYRNFSGSVSYIKTIEEETAVTKLILKRVADIKRLVLTNPDYYERVVTTCRRYGISYKPA